MASPFRPVRCSHAASGSWSGDHDHVTIPGVLPHRPGWDRGRVAGPLHVVPEAGERPPHVVVVGGGIAGLAAAHALVHGNPAPPRVTVLEGSPLLGGKLRVGQVAGVTADAGAESMLATRPEALRLVREVGLDDRIVAPATTKAGLWSRGRVQPLPSGLVMGVPTDLRALARSGTLSLPGLLRVPLDHLMPRTPLDSDVSVGSYVAARIGDEVVDRLVDPLLGGVYAGHAHGLSLQATLPALFRELADERSLLAAARRVVSTGASGSGARRGPVFVGLRGGVGQLPLAVAAALRDNGVDVRTSATVRGLERRTSGWRVLVGDTRNPETITADAVVLAVPAAPAARLLTPVCAPAAAELGEVEYASVALVTLVYRARAVEGRLAGSGFLVPSVDDRAIKAATFTSAKWDWEAEEAATGGDVGEPLAVLRVSFGRYGEESMLQRDDAELAELGHADLRAALGVTEPPVTSAVTRWGGGLPQYAVGHVARVERIRRAVSEQPGLAVCGAAYDGVGIAAVIGSARAAAARVAEHLGARGQWRHA